MMNGRLPPVKVDALREAFDEGLQENQPLARFTSARIGGAADFLLSIKSGQQLASSVSRLWELEIPFRILGGGSNILIADAGVREVILLNQARDVRFSQSPEGPHVWAESGASLGSVARRAVERGWTGLEWAATVPGTVGGAVVGNAGAHGADMAGNLLLAEILQQGKGQESWPVERLEYGYRDSWLKRNTGVAVVLSATLRLEESTVEQTKATMRAFVEHRQRTQPAGASMGSMFKNPKGDYAGRLIEQAGLKGLRIGDAQISPRHANFFLNLGEAKAADVMQLIRQARQKVVDRFGIELELEVELVGDWEAAPMNAAYRAEEGES